MSSFIFVNLDPFVEDGSLIRQASGLTNPGSALVPNLTQPLVWEYFQAQPILHPPNFKCSFYLLPGLLSSLHLSAPSLLASLFQISLLLPALHHPAGTPAPRSSSALWFQSSSWNPSPGQGLGVPPCLGEEFRLAEGTVQES